MNKGSGNRKNRRMYPLFLIVLMLQVIAAFCFCARKTGFHYDEYYSYYSSNVTWGLVPTDREWKDGTEILNEFRVLPGERFRIPTVVRMQSYDVHPPFYYILLHIACSLVPGRFSKWPGLILNLLLFVLSWFVLAALTRELWEETIGERGPDAGAEGPGADRGSWIVLAVCLLYGFNPAVLSGVMLMRMYTLLSLMILLVTFLHVRAVRTRRRGVLFYLSTAAAVWFGFLTHYYFAVYLFFLAAVMEFYLLFDRTEGRTLAARWKSCFLYGGTVIGAMLAAVAAYPACLGHIFRGYRGTEAMGAFFDLGNTPGRMRFFAGLLNEYVFGFLLPGAALILLLLCAAGFAARRRRGERTQKASFPPRRYGGFLMVLTAALGYFAVVAKTALLTAEEAIRYPLPVYGLFLMLLVLAAAALAERSGVRGLRWLSALLCLLLLAGEVRGLAGGRVLFLYEEDAPNIAFAREHHDDAAVYFYNPAVSWMIWDDSLELMQYDGIYFVSLADLSPIEDETLKEAGRIYVYCARTPDTEKALTAAQAAAGPDAKAPVLIRELLYCDLYEIRR